MSAFVSTIHALPAWQRSSVQEAAVSVTLDGVTVSTSGSRDMSFTIDLDFTCQDSLVLESIESFSFAIAYDSTVLVLDSVDDNGLQSDCGWFFGWIAVNNPGSIPPSKKVLRLVGKDNTDGSSGGLACLKSENPLIALQFHALIDSSQYDSSTTVDFIWLNCNDNVACAKDSDMIPQKFLALQVCDAHGVDITNKSDSLPSFCGPNDSCFTPYGDTLVVRAVRFRSSKIEFESPTDVAITGSDESNLPSLPMLHQNYPNPFNPATTIEFYLPERTNWRLEIINLSGQVVTGFTGADGPGNVAWCWDGRDRSNQIVSSGVYFYRLVTDKHSTSKKMLLLK